MNSKSPLYRRIVTGMGLLTAVALVSFSWQTQGADKDELPDLTLRAFMRKKLDAATKILEGLAVEDSQLIKTGADSLLEMSKAEKWNVLVDADYRQHSFEFRANVRKIAEAADKGNFDNAALQWFDITKSCIECHRDVRASRRK